MPEDSVTSANFPSPVFRYRRCRARGRDLLIHERPAVDKKQVRPAVVVVVEDDGACSHRLRQELVGARAVLVLKGNADLCRHVIEPHREILLREKRRRQQRRKKNKNRVLHQFLFVCNAASYL